MIILIENNLGSEIEEQCHTQHSCLNISLGASETGDLHPVEEDILEQGEGAWNEPARDDIPHEVPVNEVPADTHSTVLDGGDNLEQGTENTTPTTRAMKMKQMRELRRRHYEKRKKKMFQPVEGELEVKTTPRASTARGRKLLDAMEVDNKLLQDKSRRMVMCGRMWRLYIRPYQT